MPERPLVFIQVASGPGVHGNVFASEEIGLNAESGHTK